MPKIILAANTDWFLYNFRYALMHDLRALGFDVVLVSPPGKFVPRLRAEGFRWLPWNLEPHSIAPWQELFSLLHIAQIYRRERPDIVHQHTIKSVLYGSIAASLVGIPRVVNSISGRGYVFLGPDLESRLIRSFIRPFYRRALRKASSAVIFEHHGDRDFFLEAGFVPSERTWLIEGVGTDPELFSPTQEPAMPPVVLMAARTLWDKGVGVFVKAARLLHKRLKIRMVLVGEPDPSYPASVDEATLKAWHQEGVIEWWGWQQDMEKVYQQSHIVTLPTMYGEGVPTVLIEAAACGRPIVATNLPGCRVIIRDEENGLIIPQNDPQALADALERLASTPALRAKMGKAGRQLVLEKFTQQQINQATMQVYEHVLES